MSDSKNERNVGSGTTGQENIRQAILDFITFEDEPSQVWPWAMTAEEILQNEEILQKIAVTVRSDISGKCDTDELYDTISEIVGVNPTLH